MQPNLFMAVTSVCVMVLVMTLAWVNGTLLPSQRIMKDVNDLWFPVITNGAVLGNLFIMSLVVLLIGAYGEQWKEKDILFAIFIGVLVSYLLWHFVYQTGRYPDGLAKSLSSSQRFSR